MSPTLSWLLPALAYMGIMGGIGIVTKLALRHIGWQELILWTSVAYVLVGIGVFALTGARISLGAGALPALAAGFCASVSMVVFYVALSHGEAGKVVPVTSAYPVVTVVLAALVLAEGVSAARLLAVSLVVGGIALLSVAG